MNNGNGTATRSSTSQLAAKYVGKTVIAVGAHPDDLEIGIGGTLARLSQSGTRVLMVIVSVPSDLERRRAEAKKAAAILGCELQFLFPDECQRVEDLKTYQLVGMLDKLVEQHKPAAIVSHTSNNVHKDHVLVYNACLASQRIGYHDFFCYYPTSSYPIQVPFYPQAFVDISDTIEKKMASIQAHESQFEGRGRDTDHYRTAAREYGRLAGVDYAEGLEVVRMMLA